MTTNYTVDPAGFYQKYTVIRNDGKPLEPNAQWFVLMIHKDPHAVVALQAYADSVRDTNPTLAHDLDNLVVAYTH